MAKIKKCALCGKEMKAGFFTGENYTLDTGILFDCCEQCYEKYEEFADRENKRFAIKISNYKTAHKIGIFKSLGEKGAQFFLKYYEEGQAYINKSKGLVPNRQMGFYQIDQEGHFWYNEADLEAVNSISVNKDQIKTLEKNLWDEKSSAFTKEDISRLDFFIKKQGNQVTLFHSYYDVFIRLNDEKEISYKPAIAKTVVPGGFPIGSRKRAKKEIINMLENMKLSLGLNFKIVEYTKNFKKTV